MPPTRLVPVLSVFAYEANYFLPQNAFSNQFTLGPIVEGDTDVSEPAKCSEMTYTVSGGALNSTQSNNVLLCLR